MTWQRMIPIVALAASLATPAAARSTFDYYSTHTTQPSVPGVLQSDEREYYRTVFAAIKAEQWPRVEELLGQKRDGPLHGVARAQYYLAATSPRIELPAIRDWLERWPHLPQAAQMRRLGERRGAMAQDLPVLPRENTLVSLPQKSKRTRPSPVNDGTMPANVAAAILEHIRNSNPDGARQLLEGIDAGLSAEALAEWRQRVGWSYYIENNDAAALSMGEWADEGRGAWVAEGAWTAGLAAWRMGDCERAASLFERTAQRAYNPELAAAGYYWAARAHTRCRKPERVKELLKGAAAKDQTLYGMLATEQLGQNMPVTYAAADFDRRDWNVLKDHANVRTAVGLVEIGEVDLASIVLRHQARIGDPKHYDALTRMARAFGMPQTQIWMAYNAPQGGRPDPASSYPVPKWRPVTGWRVDPALVYAHALQESNFRAEVVSPAGARGVMQIMPATARQHAPSINMNGSVNELNDPQINMAFGQRTMEAMRDNPATGALLPKVMAAYNAGLTPVARWNSQIRDHGDPLTWMESIPYWETRGYVAIVMRNYWMYERQAKAPSATRAALAQNAWPGFPQIQGDGSIRVAAVSALLSEN